MNSREFWSRIFGFKEGDRVRIINPHSSSFGLKGTIVNIMRLKKFILYEVEISTPFQVTWAVFRHDELELVIDEK